MEWALCSTVAALITIFDIVKTFYVPGTIRRWLQFITWALLFLVANGALASLLYSTVRDKAFLQSLGVYPRALLVGASYLVVVRAKLATLKTEKEEIPLGFEYFYNSAKEFVYRGMNHISIQALTEESSVLAAEKTLKELASKVNAYITNNNLLSDREKTVRKSWVLKTLDDTISEDEKRVALATYILAEKM